MKLLIGAGVTAVVIVMGLAVAPASRRPAQAPGSKPVVVVELFTSEGCSSCPAADDVLRQLAEGQTPGGLEIIALGEHVDYWDRLGWRDPFSSPAFSARQSAYDAAVFRTNGIYTPQVVVDGAFQVVGNDAGAVRRTLIAAAREPKAAVALTAAALDHGRVQLDLRVDIPDGLAPRGASDIVAAVTEDGLVTRVQRGENSGRTLRHAGVVRSLATIGALAKDQRSWSGPIVIPVDAAWLASRLRIAVFIQERASRRILGGAAVSPAKS